MIAASASCYPRGAITLSRSPHAINVGDAIEPSSALKSASIVSRITACADACGQLERLRDDGVEQLRVERLGRSDCLEVARERRVDRVVQLRYLAGERAGDGGVVRPRRDGVGEHERSDAAGVVERDPLCDG
jgi:hypothetical protein